VFEEEVKSHLSNVFAFCKHFTFVFGLSLEQTFKNVFENTKSKNARKTWLIAAF
jgi:hypothetical protein